MMLHTVTATGANIVPGLKINERQHILQRTAACWPVSLFAIHHHKP